MSKSGNIYKLAAILWVSSLSVVTAAPTQGILGATSTGIANISITKSLQAQITDVKDMTRSNWNIGDGDVTLTSDLCVYSSSGNYTITATGSGTANAFTLASGSNTLSYSVTWNGGGAGNLANTGSLLLPGIGSLPFLTADSGSATCTSGANDTARVIVKVLNLSMILASASTTPFTGTLTMLITPF